MNIMDANGAIACAECAKNARNERDQLQAENEKLLEQKIDAYNDMVIARLDADALQAENAKLRELVRDVVLLAGCEGCDVTKMQLHVQGGDWRTVWERMTELGVPGTEVDA